MASPIKMFTQKIRINVYNTVYRVVVGPNTFKTYFMFIKVLLFTNVIIYRTNRSHFHSIMRPFGTPREIGILCSEQIFISLIMPDKKRTC